MSNFLNNVLWVFYNLPNISVSGNKNNKTYALEENFFLGDWCKCNQDERLLSFCYYVRELPPDTKQWNTLPLFVERKDEYYWQK